MARGRKVSSSDKRKKTTKGNIRYRACTHVIERRSDDCVNMLKVTYLYCFHYVVSYSIFVSLLFQIEISVIKNSQIGAKICALSYKNKLNIGQPCRFFCYGMIFDHTSKMIG